MQRHFSAMTTVCFARCCSDASRGFALPSITSSRQLPVHRMSRADEGQVGVISPCTLNSCLALLLQAFFGVLKGHHPALANKASVD